MGAGWILPAFSLTLVFPSPSVQWPESVLGLWCIEQRTHAHSRTRVFCLHTKSILHSSKKMKAILIIQSVFAGMRTRTRRQRERVREELFYVFPLRQKRQSVRMIESLCVRERGNEK